MGFTVDMSGAAEKVKKICSSRKLGSFLASEAAKGMDQYVPMRTGALSKSVTTQPFEIKYGISYAKYPYNGRHMRFSKDKHPSATSHWDRAYAIAHGQQLADSGTRFLKRLR